MKGMFELTETFLKMLTTAYLALILLAMFFALNTYYLYFEESEVSRDVLALGDGILFSDCLTVEQNGRHVKALMNQTLLELDVAYFGGTGNSCIKYGKPFNYAILTSMYDDPIYEVGKPLDPDEIHSALFPASLKTDSGDIVGILINVSVEQ